MSKFHTTSRVVGGDETNYTAEARLVQSRAERGEPSAIRLNDIVFFSTAGGDAWMFDAKDGEAACLARAGRSEVVLIEETDQKLLVAWQADCRIEDDTFTVIERDGSTCSFIDYPMEEIRNLVGVAANAPKADAADPLAAADRLQRTKRNDACPCGSGKKYKRCCLDRDEASVRQAKVELAARPMRRGELAPATKEDLGAPDMDEEVDARPDEASAAPHSDRTLRFAPEVERRLDELWREFDAYAHPTTEQMDALLGQLLALPPEATDWNDVLHRFAQHEHADLPGVFRRIVAQVPPTKDTALGFVCWAALEEFTGRERVDLMPEIVAVCRMLDGESYDADAMHHVREYALAEGCEAEALALAEHFLPILRADTGLMDWTVPAACGEIFELRVGGRLRATDGTADDPEALARELRRDLDEEIDAGYTAHAARVICRGGSAAAWTRTDFDLTNAEGVDDTPEWRAALRRLEALMQVAREAWQFDGHPPGCAFRELQLLVGAAYDERETARGKRKHTSVNLLDCLHDRIESRVARSSQGFLGCDISHARLLLNGHRHLLRFAQRHQLIAAEVAARTENELDRLQAAMLRP
jgi:hypothetical protein